MPLLKIIRYLVIFLVVGGIFYWLGSMLLSAVFTATGLTAPSTPSATSQATKANVFEADASGFVDNGGNGDSPTESGLKPTAATPAGYRPPLYDPFHNRYVPYHDFEELLDPADRGNNSAPTADFRTRTLSAGLADMESGTTNTVFVFDASPSLDSETRGERLQVRWDYDSDGTPETWFSQKKRVVHTFEESGIYTVTAEVLDNGGLVSRISKEVRVVNNTDPSAHFTYSPETGTGHQIFTFQTRQSRDSQYLASYLEQRFDWNGDGTWDTPYQRKSTWKHRFEEAGKHEVILETRDPEGATDTARATITVTENQPPRARFTATQKTQRGNSESSGDNGDSQNNGSVRFIHDIRYTFDASESSDFEAEDALLYRWDFNYEGSDDIHFDTRWSSTPRYSGSFQLPGTKTVRLQVKDQDGAVSEAVKEVRIS